MPTTPWRYTTESSGRSTRSDGWIEPTEADIAEASNRVGRYGFVGHRDKEMEKRYVFADVTEYLPERGGRNPIRYVNC